MAAKNRNDRRLVGQIGAAERWGTNSDEARRELAARRLEEHIKRVVDQAPALSDAQRVRLTLLLNGGGS